MPVGETGRSIMASLLATFLTFLLLPLSQLAEDQLWEVRTVDWIEIPKPPPPKPKLEEQIEQEKRDAPKPLEIKPPRPKLTLQALEASLDVSPGDFRSAFALDQFTGVSDLGGELLFELHQLDQRPMALRKSSLRYPPHLKRKGIEGEVRLLVQIDEKGILRVESLISSDHPDFVPPSVEAAEETPYSIPTYDGKPVKTQFVLPVHFTIIKP
jgi:TonB family protein